MIGLAELISDPEEDPLEKLLALRFVRDGLKYGKYGFFTLLNS